MSKGIEGVPHSESYYTVVEAKNALIEDWEALQAFDKREAAKPLPSFAGQTTEEMDNELSALEHAEIIQREPYESSLIDTWRDDISPEQKPEIIKQLMAEGKFDLIRFLYQSNDFQFLDEATLQVLKQNLELK